MKQYSNSAAADSQLRGDLIGCAYAAFLEAGIPDEDKPELIRMASAEEFSADKLESYIVSDLNKINETLKFIKSPLENLCITYGLLEIMGDSFSESDYQSLKENMLQNYLGMLLAARIAADIQKREVESYVVVSAKLMLPMLLPKFLKLSMGSLGTFAFEGGEKYKILSNADLLDKVITAPELIAAFLREYADVKITSMAAYFAFLYESTHLLYILFHQDCAGVTVDDISGLVGFIKDKKPSMGPEEILTDENIALLHKPLKMLTATCSRVMPENKGIYLASKSVLFSLFLDELNPLPGLPELSPEQFSVFKGLVNELGKSAFTEGKLSQQQYEDVFVALFICDDRSLVEYSISMREFPVSSLVTLVKRIQGEVMPFLSGWEVLQYLNLILRSGLAAGDRHTTPEGKEFFASTKEIFREMFMEEMKSLAEPLYTKTDECYKEGTPYDVLKSCNIIILMELFRQYKVLYPEAHYILKGMQIINLAFMDYTKSWSNPKACSLLQEVFESFAVCGITKHELDFVTVSRAIKLLLEKSAASSKLVVSKDDYAFWKQSPELFCDMYTNIHLWSEEQKEIIDKAFLTILPRMSFDKNNQGVSLTARVCVLLLKFVSKSAAAEFYKKVDVVLEALSNPAGVLVDAIHQLALLHQWLINVVVEKSDKVANSRVLNKLDVFSPVQSTLIDRVLHLCQLSEALYLIMQRYEHFNDEQELYARIEKIRSFLLTQRKRTVNDLKASKEAIPAAKDAILMLCGPKHLDQDMLGLLKIKPAKKAVQGRSNKYKTLAITKISLSKNSLAVFCGQSEFTLGIARPALIILKAEVRCYSDGTFKLYLGDYSGTLMGLTPLAPGSSAKGQGAAAELPKGEDELLAWIEEDSSNTKGKKSKAKAVKLGKSAEALSQNVEEVAASDHAPENTTSQTGATAKKSRKKKKKANRAAALLPAAGPELETELSEDQPESGTTNGFESVIDQLKNAKLGLDVASCFREIINLVKDELGFRVEFMLRDGSPTFSLGPAAAQLDLNKDAAELWQELAALPKCFLKHIGLANFVSPSYDAEGRIIELASDASLFEHFAVPPIAVCSEDVLSATQEWISAFVLQLETKLKIDVSFDGGILYLTLGISSSSAAAASEPEVRLSLDLQQTDAAQFFPEILKLYKRLCLRRYGNCMVFVNLVFSKNHNLIAIARSDYLPATNTSLLRVNLLAQNLSQALDAFFAPIDKRSFDLFRILSMTQTEFILKVMAAMKVDIFIYGLPVLELCHGETLRGMGVGRQALEQLTIRIDKHDTVGHIAALREDLAAPAIGAVVESTSQEILCCSYKGSNIAVCLGHKHMMSSPFSGDHHNCKLSYPALDCTLSSDNPAAIGPAVAAGAKKGKALFSENGYALGTALWWSKVKGKIGGSLREILAELGFPTMVSSPGFSENIWLDGSTGSGKLLPGAASYLCKTFHLASEKEGARVLEEVNSMLKDGAKP